MAVESDRFTVEPRFFWRQLIPWPFRQMWCRERNPQGIGVPWGDLCRFRFDHPFPHEDYQGRSW